jgi:hypothetical protein
MINMYVDCGLNRSGVAIFVDGVLQVATTYSVNKKTVPKLANRVLDMATLCASRPLQIDRLVIEWQQVYQERKRSRLDIKTGKRKRARQDPNDLLPLTGIAGAIAANVRQSSPDVEVEFVLPAKWKGQLPKKLPEGLNPVADRATRLLTPAELALTGGLPHDGWDAIGLGLWDMGKFSGRRFAGASRG